MKRKKLNVLTMVAIMMSSLMMLTSCTSNEDQPVADPALSRITDAVVGQTFDPSLQDIYGLLRYYDISKDGEFYCTSVLQCDNDSDETMKEDEYQAFFVAGSWKPVAAHYNELLGETFDAISVDYEYLGAISSTTQEVKESSDGTVYKDIILVIPSEVEGINYMLWESDLEALAEDLMDEESAETLTRGDKPSFLERLTNVCKDSIKKGTPIFTSWLDTIGKKFAGICISLKINLEDTAKKVVDTVKDTINFGEKVKNPNLHQYNGIPKDMFVDN